ncbi:MAG: hypothetical protein AAF605_00525 [Myxococcota bacterium]
MVGWMLAGAAVVMVAREIAWFRERGATHKALKALGDAFEQRNQSIRRLQEDLYVLQSVMRERNMLSDHELVSARKRLVEQPKRVAEERDAIQRNLNVGIPSQVIKESINKLH